MESLESAPRDLLARHHFSPPRTQPSR